MLSVLKHCYSNIIIHMQIVIPSGDTTYWCAAFELPQDIQNQERYIIRVIMLYHSYYGVDCFSGCHKHLEGLPNL